MMEQLLQNKDLVVFVSFMTISLMFILDYITKKLFDLIKYIVNKIRRPIL